MTLTEFLLARTAEDEAFLARERWAQDDDPQMREHMRQAWEGSFAAACAQFAIALRGVAHAWFWSFHREAAKREALRYADHPDFDPAWSITAAT